MRQFSWLILLALACLMTVPALASALPGGGGGSLPWETPLTEIKDSLTGPVATAIGMMGFVIAGATLVFGGDLSGFARTVLMLILAVSVLLGAGALLGRFSGSGALINDAPPLLHSSAASLRGRGSWSWN